MCMFLFQMDTGESSISDIFDILELKGEGTHMSSILNK